jgi:hypothetical protein
MDGILCSCVAQKKVGLRSQIIIDLKFEFRVPFSFTVVETFKDEILLLLNQMRSVKSEDRMKICKLIL